MIGITSRHGIQAIELAYARRLRLAVDAVFADRLSQILDAYGRENVSLDQTRVDRIMNMVDDTNEQIAYLRSSIIGLLVEECSRVFMEKEEDIMNGVSIGPLIDHICDPARKAYAACSAMAYKKIYQSHEVVDVELAGYRIFSQLNRSRYEPEKYLQQTTPSSYPGSVRHTSPYYLWKDPMCIGLYLRND